MTEEKLFAGKYKTAEDLENGYSELSKMVRERDTALNDYKSKYSAPEKYDFSDFQMPDSHLVPVALEAFKGMGISNEMAKNFFKAVLEADQKAIGERTKRELEALGPDGDKILGELKDFAGKALTEEERDALTAITSSAAGVKLAHKLYQLSKSKDVPSPAEGVSNTPPADPKAAALSFLEKHGVDKIGGSADLQKEYYALLSQVK
jgi:hypothetical protein